VRPSTHRAVSHERKVSANTTDIQQFTMPKETSAIEFCIEGANSARVTFDSSDPSAASAPSLVYPSGQVPCFRPVGPGTIIRFVSTAASPCVMQMAYYT